jgi:hypothetical protein
MIIGIMTPKESNVYSQDWIVFDCATPKESNVYSQDWNVFDCATPKESNVDINVPFSINTQSLRDCFYTNFFSIHNKKQ